MWHLVLVCAWNEECMSIVERNLDEAGIVGVVSWAAACSASTLLWSTGLTPGCFASASASCSAPRKAAEDGYGCPSVAIYLSFTYIFKGKRKAGTMRQSYFVNSLPECPNSLYCTKWVLLKPKNILPCSSALSWPHYGGAQWLCPSSCKAKYKTKEKKTHTLLFLVRKCPHIGENVNMWTYLNKGHVDTVKLDFGLGIAWPDDENFRTEKPWN